MAGARNGLASIFQVQWMSGAVPLGIMQLGRSDTAKYGSLCMLVQLIHICERMRFTKVR